jgi:hypothetical protein
MIGWEADKRWSDRFLHQIKGIIGQSLIGEPPIAEDRERNTDLMVLKMDAVRIACRVRRHDQQKYVGEFTVRSGRPSGMKTELAKIIEGWGDYLFYGFSDASEGVVENWILGDLSAFRIWHSRELVRRKGVPPGYRKENHDRSSSFCAYKAFDIPEFVVSTDMPIPHRQIAA